ncbi:MAG TPA: hypothetical protein VIP77_21045 [Jiangellaceae bacterium]
MSGGGSCARRSSDQDTRVHRDHHAVEAFMNSIQGESTYAFFDKTWRAGELELLA